MNNDRYQPKPMTPAQVLHLTGKALYCHDFFYSRDVFDTVLRECYDKRDPEYSFYKAVSSVYLAGYVQGVRAERGKRREKAEK